MTINHTDIFDKQGNVILNEKVFAYLKKYCPTAVRSIERISKNKELFTRPDSVVDGEITLFIPGAFNSLADLVKNIDSAPAPVAQRSSFDTRVGKEVLESASKEFEDRVSKAPNVLGIKTENNGSISASKNLAWDPSKHNRMVEGNGPAMCDRKPDDYPENCDCDRCQFMFNCNTSCDCVDELDYDYLIRKSPDNIIINFVHLVADLVANNVTDIPNIAWIIDEHSATWEDEKDFINSKDAAWLKKYVFNIVKNRYNGIVDKECLIEYMEHTLSYVYAETLLHTKRNLQHEELTANNENGFWTIVSRVLCKLACDEYLLEWHNVVMTRKGYNRVAKIVLDMQQIANARAIGVTYHNGLTLPKRWDIWDK